MASKPLPSQEELRALLDYEPETGALAWKPRPAFLFAPGLYPAERLASIWNARFAGEPAFTTTTPSGYHYSSIDSRKVYAHRVIWKLVTGDEPVEVDHINGDPSDNRFTNLRSVSHAENGRNSKLPRDNRSGCIGVHWNSECSKWAAEIRANGQRHYLGLFATREAAAAARKAAERRLDFHPNHGRKTKEDCHA